MTEIVIFLYIYIFYLFIFYMYIKKKIKIESYLTCEIYVILDLKRLFIFLDSRQPLSSE